MNTFSAYYDVYRELQSMQYAFAMSSWKGKLPKSNKRNQRRNK